jgi:hypothetical protein
VEGKGRVEVEGRVFRLVVEGHHLDVKLPEEHRIEIERVDAHSGQIGPQHLRLRVEQDRFDSCLFSCIKKAFCIFFFTKSLYCFLVVFI